MPHDRDPSEASDRRRSIEHLYEEFATITRRASARERTGASPITLVDHGLLALVQARPGISPSDLARVLELNRSTTSRQIAALHAAGLLDREGGNGRPYSLTVTAAGERALAASRSAHLAALEARLASWDTTRVGDLAAVLGEFNAEG
jgi:DNA-binding MarR family transcriptional regulator